MDTALEHQEKESSQDVSQGEKEPQEQPDMRPIAGPFVNKYARKSDRGGYDCEFVQPPPVSLRTECVICCQVLRSPHLTTCCGKNFCKDCIGRILNDGKSCPLCNAQKFTLTYNRDHDVALKELEVYCTHRQFGCEWKGILEMLDKHLNVDPKLIDKQLEGCNFTEIMCFNDGCGKYFQRPDIVKHQCEDCPLRLYTCEYCGECKSTFYDVWCNHWPCATQSPALITAHQIQWNAKN